MDSDMEYIYKHYIESSFDSSDKEDYADGTMMMQAVLADAECSKEHFLNFKASIKGHRVLNRTRAQGHLTLMDDYFASTLFTDNFRLLPDAQKCVRSPLQWWRFALLFD